MPRKKNPDHVQRTYECDNPECSERVLATRPSKSGFHYCSTRPDCQAAKQKRLRSVRGETPKADLANHALALLGAVLHRDRVKCGGCGLTNALPGYAHPDGKGGACVFTGATSFGGTGGASVGFAPRAVETLWPAHSSTWGPES